jgi:hypothetical protein
MREKEVITEAIAGEITVGFELEIVVPGARSFGSRFSDMEPGTLIEVHPNIQRIVDKYGLARMEELSVSANKDDTDTHFGAEFDIGLIKDENGAKARLTATPPNFQKVATIIKEFLDNGAYTNSSCGFHAHFGLGQLEKTSGMDATWFSIYFLDSGLWDKYSTYKGIKQYDDTEYASLNDLRESVEQFKGSLEHLTAKENKLEYAYDQTVNKLAMGVFNKYNVLNPHDQGGLRGVFDDLSGQVDNYNLIVDYLKFVYKFARDLGQAQDKLLDYDVAGVTLRELKRFYFENKQKQKGSISNVAQLFVSHFSPIMPSAKFKNTHTDFTKHLSFRNDAVNTKQYDNKTYLNSLNSQMAFSAQALQPFVGRQAWGTPESRMNVILRPQGAIGLEIDLYDMTYDNQAFEIDPGHWNELVPKFGWGMWNCVFETCQFLFKDPKLYKFKINELFLDALYTDCVAVFKTMEEAEYAKKTWTEFHGHGTEDIHFMSIEQL